MSKILLKPNEYSKVSQEYLEHLSDDELLQVYVIAGVFATVDGIKKWGAPTKRTRKMILSRMKEWGVAQ